MTGIIEIVDRLGRRRRAKPHEVLADGESFSMQMQFLDAQIHDHLTAKFNLRMVVDDAGTKAGHRPGFLLCDQASDDAAAAAYGERSKRLRSAWRKRPEDEGDDPQQQLAPPGEQESSWLRRQALARKAAAEAASDDSKPMTLDASEAAAVKAFETRCERLRNAWRRR